MKLLVYLYPFHHFPPNPFSPQISSSLNPIYRHPRPPPPSNTHEPAISTNVQQHVGSISVSIFGSSSISISTGAVGPAPSPSPDLREAPPFVLHLQATLSSLEKIRQLGPLHLLQEEDEISQIEDEPKLECLHLPQDMNLFRLKITFLKMNRSENLVEDNICIKMKMNQSRSLIEYQSIVAMY
ncbi:uncharacterized protein LOC133881161 [Alnus glutinosa]|uniref:uncharacterized protein LOC133881161 n=1 Tax=Alnus glutinosa TaxID=3517 RepID=UPI002D799DC5|nr:uncharacterized protein LOC133881161 [Alnus glutinosa]